jgi:dipeptidyl aminopeptidase/acylaminoacyl peptidase
MRNGRILHQNADNGFWQGYTAPPPPPGGEESYHWDAFDQDTGSFLYAAESRPHVWVVGEGGLVAEFDCPPSSGCEQNQMGTFGPGPDEITVPSADFLSAHVIGFDGTLRDTLDISRFFQGQIISDLAWSPDGSRLAVSTQNTTRCDRSGGPCGRVWIFDRDGSEPQLAYTDRTTRFGGLRDLAWSPDGDNVALLVGPQGGLCTGRMLWPRLVVLRVAPGEPDRAETLKVYDDEPNATVCILSDHYHLAFPFAWSPDGTRRRTSTDARDTAWVRRDRVRVTRIP